MLPSCPMESSCDLSSQWVECQVIHQWCSMYYVVWLSAFQTCSITDEEQQVPTRCSDSGGGGRAVVWSRRWCWRWWGPPTHVWSSQTQAGCGSWQHTKNMGTQERWVAIRMLEWFFMLKASLLGKGHWMFSFLWRLQSLIIFCRSNLLLDYFLQTQPATLFFSSWDTSFACWHFKAFP